MIYSLSQRSFVSWIFYDHFLRELKLRNYINDFEPSSLTRLPNSLPWINHQTRDKSLLKKKKKKKNILPWNPSIFKINSNNNKNTDISSGFQ